MTKPIKGQILFVDEDTDTCDLMCTLLERAGYLTVTASSVTEGLQQAKTRTFDLILLDWFLEDGTGIDLCKGIRGIDAMTPIFFYTGVSFPQELKKALDAGAQGYFIKPVEIEGLLRTIEHQIQVSKVGDNAMPRTGLNE
jgi:two-component system, NtrC family, response regulator AtoC